MKPVGLKGLVPKEEADSSWVRKSRKLPLRPGRPGTQVGCQGLLEVVHSELTKGEVLGELNCGT